MVGAEFYNALKAIKCYIKPEQKKYSPGKQKLPFAQKTAPEPVFKEACAAKVAEGVGR